MREFLAKSALTSILTRMDFLGSGEFDGSAETMAPRPVSCSILALVALLSLWGGPVLAENKSVSGNVLYRERIALPPNAVVEVRLLDVSRADVPADEISSVSLRPKTSQPFPFELEYDADRIDPRFTYSVQAKIIADGRLMFISDQVYPVLTRGRPDTVDIMVRRVANKQPESSETVGQLVGGTWIAEEIEGRRLIENTQVKISILPDGTVHGSGGCNSFRGAAEISGSTLKFGKLAATLMACPQERMEQERKVFDALGATKTYRIDGAHLKFFDIAGTTVAKFARP